KQIRTTSPTKAPWTDSKLRDSNRAGSIGRALLLRGARCERIRCSNAVAGLARRWSNRLDGLPRRAGLMAVERQTACANGPCGTTHVALVVSFAVSRTLCLLSLAR